MKVGQLPSQLTQGIRADSPIEVKKGDILTSTIKERLPNKEAIIQLRGKDVQVKFEGNVPSGDKVTIQVVKADGDIPLVRSVTDGVKGQSVDADITKVIRNFGATATPELKAAVKYALEQGIPLSKESVADLKVFLEKHPGVMKQKLETVKMIANKGLEITSLHLNSVHEALYGKPISQQLSDLTRSLGMDLPTQPTGGKSTVRDGINQIRESLREEPDLGKAIQQVREQIVQNSKIDPDVAIKVEKALGEANLLQKVGREAAARERVVWALQQAEVEVIQEVEALPEAIRQAKEAVRQEPNLQRAIQQVKDLVANNPDLDPHIVESINKVVNQALQLRQAGLEPIGRNKLINELRETEENLSSNKNEPINGHQSFQKTTEDPNDPFQLNEDLLAGIKLGAKDIVITHITNRMAQAAAEFKELKRETTRNLDNVIRFTESTKSNVYPQIKEVLQSTIDIIDKAILKSDFVMFADMETEKRLMTVSMDLATAKKLLANGENSQAATLLREIKTKLEALNWRPADVKVRHMVATERLFSETNSEKHIVKPHVDPFLSNDKLEGSARNTFESIRTLGLNYDSEAAQSLVSSQDGGHEEQLQKNMKAVIMKLLDSDGAAPLEPRVDQQAKEVLQNITGQQLLSKSEAGSPLQTMFLSLPLRMGANTETVKVFVNGKKDGQKIDWENCSLYFLMDTKKIGEMGILLTANNRNLSITLKNDTPMFKEKMETIASRCKEKLEEIGYNIAALQFTKLTTVKEIPEQNRVIKPSIPQPQTITKGFDFTV